MSALEDLAINCDKCGKPVPFVNDAVNVESLAFDSPYALLFCLPRHFLPTEDCEGSPSRAQYIEGQPLDSRGHYGYRAEYEQRWRDGYAKVLKMAENNQEK